MKVSEIVYMHRNCVVSVKIYRNPKKAIKEYAKRKKRMWSHEDVLFFENVKVIE